ncbi:MAG: hypothetical protein CVT69_02230 [Actinobacteria bacterium HGW-Actinobacteria-9]|nr:MAG: hypothetical protein CVT69_02230 [Actinobacteria bacterium HGW-Actinobacteria-9]
MGMPARHYYTAADLLALPDDGNKYEVVHGELLVSPGPRPLHQLVLGRLDRLIGTYLDGHPVGVCFPGGDISWFEDTLVIPDLLVAEMTEACTLSWNRMRTLLLVVEILSPSSTRPDRFTKRRLYQEVGVPLYWLVDADAKTFEIWTPESLFPTTEREEVLWHPAGADTPLVVSLEELFRAP